VNGVDNVRRGPGPHLHHPRQLGLPVQQGKHDLLRRQVQVGSWPKGPVEVTFHVGLVFAVVAQALENVKRRVRDAVGDGGRSNAPCQRWSQGLVPRTYWQARYRQWARPKEASQCYPAGVH